MATMLFSLPVTCSACDHEFTVSVDSKKVTTGGELDVLRLNPTGQETLVFVELGELPTVCPNCGASFS